MKDYIISEDLNERLYAYYRGRFWFWSVEQSRWMESHLHHQKFEKAKEENPRLTPEDYLTQDGKFYPMDDYELPSGVISALEDAKPSKLVPTEPLEEPAPDTLAVTASAPILTTTVKETTPAVDDTRTSVAPAGFDFGVDAQTNALLMQDAQTFIMGNMTRIMAAKHAHDLCANNKNGTWGKWCEAVGISRDTGDNMVHIAEQFGNIQLEGQSIFDVQPMKLLYAAAKPSAPPELVQKVKDGDITSHKQYQEALAQVKAKEDELAQVKKSLDAEIADNDQLHEEKARLLKQCEASKNARITAEQRAKADADKINELVERNDELDYKLHLTRTDLNGLMEQNQKLAAEKEKLLDERDEHIRTIRKLETRPVEVMAPDKEEIDRLAQERADGLASARNAELAGENAALKEQLDAMQEFVTDVSQDDFATAYHFVDGLKKDFELMIPVFLRLMEADRERVCRDLVELLSRLGARTIILADGKDPRSVEYYDPDEDDEWEDEDV